jgi:hypothetical protein
VTDAALADGLLSISLQREVPEALKPRRIEINTGDTAAAAPVIEGEKVKDRRLTDGPLFLCSIPPLDFGRRSDAPPFFV